MNNNRRLAGDVQLRPHLSDRAPWPLHAIEGDQSFCTAIIVMTSNSTLYTWILNGRGIHCI